MDQLWTVFSLLRVLQVVIMTLSWLAFVASQSLLLYLTPRPLSVGWHIAFPPTSLVCLFQQKEPGDVPRPWGT